MEGKTPVHRARYCCLFAAVGTLKMPSGTLLRENRGRWKPFYISTGRASRNVSPPRQKIHRLMKCSAFTSQNPSPPPQKCLASVSQNVPPLQRQIPRLLRNYSRPKAFLMTSTESRSSHPKNWTFSRLFLPWMFISTLARYGLRPTWPYAAVGS